MAKKRGTRSDDLFAPTPATVPLEVKRLVQGFAQHIKELKAPEYKESSVRGHYIDPFWEQLGWDVYNKQQRAPQDIEVQVEPSIDTLGDDGLKSREPDYLFRLNGFSRFIVEAKKPAVDLDADRPAIFQAKRYAWSSSIPFAILTDFEQFRLYDTTLKPDIKLPSRGLVEEWKVDFQDYPAKWAAFVATFGRAAVAAGSLEELLRQVKKLKAGRRLRTVDRTLFDLKGAEPVDRVFLDYLEKFRQHFARAIYRENKKDFPEADTLRGAAKLTETVQRLLDRLVFMRVCEDRGVSKYGGLRRLLERASAANDLTAALQAEFRSLDREYNGYLFKFHAVLDQIQLPEDTVADFIRTIYPPDGPWDFAKIGDDVLGIVYERFLGHTVVVSKGQVDVVEKPEVRHAGGVYYTPRFVVETIIRRVVGPQVASKSPAQLLDVQILDPACGSGSFLVAAFHYLIEHCRAAVAADPALASIPATPKARKQRKEIAFKDKKGGWHLAPDFKALLLTNCLYGVDIDQQAVEVTVMSLYLKMLEGELPDGWQKEWLENELLPSLDNNIRCGNSLIDPLAYDKYLMDCKHSLFDEDADTKFRMKRFDWRSRQNGFGAILDDKAVLQRERRGFDCIIGNPPYIRVQELNEWAPEECEFYKWQYKSAKKGNYDIYVVFVERCLELLAPNGLLGFIMPHKFWQAQYGEGLRKLLADGKHVQGLVDFGDQQVFHGVTTYTAIHILSRAGNASGVDYAKVLQLQDGIVQCAELDSGRAAIGVARTVAAQPQGQNEWSFKSAGTTEWCNVVASVGASLGELADVFVGVQTSADDIYHLDLLKLGKATSTVRSRVNDKVWELENCVLHPLASGEDTRAHTFAVPRQVILYPYNWTGTGRADLMAAHELLETAPTVWAYLKAHEKRLRAREGGKFDIDKWYQFGRSQNLGRQKGVKLCVPRLADRLRCAFDEGGERCLDNVDVNGVRIKSESRLPPTKENYLFLSGIVNSALAEAYIRASVSTHFRGGFASYNRQFIDALPIKLPETADEKKKAARITESVRAIMAAKTQLRDAKLSDQQRNSLTAEIEAHETRINTVVFALYGVDGLPAQPS